MYRNRYFWIAEVKRFQKSSTSSNKSLKVVDIKLGVCTHSLSPGVNGLKNYVTVFNMGSFREEQFTCILKQLSSVTLLASNLAEFHLQACPPNGRQCLKWSVAKIGQL